MTCIIDRRLNTKHGAASEMIETLKMNPYLGLKGLKTGTDANIQKMPCHGRIDGCMDE